MQKIIARLLLILTLTSNAFAETATSGNLLPNANVARTNLQNSSGNLDGADDINKTFIPAYAMTIHKTQGDTIDGRVNIHEHISIIGDKKLHYTAVSRAKDISLVKYFV